MSQEEVIILEFLYQKKNYIIIFKNIYLTVNNAELESLQDKWWRKFRRNEIYITMNSNISKLTTGSNSIPPLLINFLG